MSTGRESTAASNDGEQLAKKFKDDDRADVEDLGGSRSTEKIGFSFSGNTDGNNVIKKIPNNNFLIADGKTDKPKLQLNLSKVNASMGKKKSKNNTKNNFYLLSKEENDDNKYLQVAETVEDVVSNKDSFVTAISEKEAMQLVKIDGGEMSVKEEALRVLEAMGAQEVKVLAVTGKQRSGKSFLLSRMLTWLGETADGE